MNKCCAFTFSISTDEAKNAVIVVPIFAPNKIGTTPVNAMESIPSAFKHIVVEEYQSMQMMIELIVVKSVQKLFLKTSY
jgi:hypothetical protein